MVRSVRLKALFLLMGIFLTCSGCMKGNAYYFDKDKKIYVEYYPQGTGLARYSKEDGGSTSQIGLQINRSIVCVDIDSTVELETLQKAIDVLEARYLNAGINVVIKGNSSVPLETILDSNALLCLDLGGIEPSHRNCLTITKHPSLKYISISIHSVTLH